MKKADLSKLFKNKKMKAWVAKNDILKGFCLKMNKKSFY